MPEERNGEENTCEIVIRIYEDVTILCGSSKIFECRVVEKRADQSTPKRGLGNLVSHKIYEELLGIADILTYGPINYTAPLTSLVDFATGNE